MKHLIISQVQTGGTIGAQKLYGISNEVYEQVMDLLNNNSIIETGSEFGEDITEGIDDTDIIKAFKDVKIGDFAHHESCESPDDESEGPIIWIGDTNKLRLEQPGYIDKAEEEEDWIDLEEYDKWVIIDVPIYGYTLYNYNIDSSGVKVFK